MTRKLAIGLAIGTTLLLLAPLSAADVCAAENSVSLGSESPTICPRTLGVCYGPFWDEEQGLEVTTPRVCVG